MLSGSLTQEPHSRNGGSCLGKIQHLRQRSVANSQSSCPEMCQDCSLEKISGLRVGWELPCVFFYLGKLYPDCQRTFFHTEKSSLPVTSEYSEREEDLGFELQNFIIFTYLAPCTFNFWLKLHFRFAHPITQSHQSTLPLLAGFPVSPMEIDLRIKEVSRQKVVWRERMRFGSK